jgi:hypothetical protein
MPLTSNIDPVVEQLEASLMPKFSEFARAIMQSDVRIAAETCSNRHAPTVHVFGIACRPAGTRDYDLPRVALVVNVIAIRRLCFHASIVWQTSLREWALGMGSGATTRTYHGIGGRNLANFEREALSLLPSLAHELHRCRAGGVVRG